MDKDNPFIHYAQDMLRLYLYDFQLIGRYPPAISVFKTYFAPFSHPVHKIHFRALMQNKKVGTALRRRTFHRNGRSKNYRRIAMNNPCLLLRSKMIGTYRNKHSQQTGKESDFTQNDLLDKKVQDDTYEK